MPMLTAVQGPQSLVGSSALTYSNHPIWASYCDLRRFCDETKALSLFRQTIGGNGASALYFDDMRRQYHTYTRLILLALMLAVGSVQAHASYFCSMMDTVLHDDCCCADADIDEMAPMGDSDPCCEKSIELGIDSTSDQMQTSIKPIKFESDVDPPDAFVFIASLVLASQDIPSLSNANDARPLHNTGCATYLITQRLRI